MADFQPAAPQLFYASQSGRSTLDQDEGGGSPFASALVELFGRPSLTYGELRSELVTLTQEKSRGFQVPEAPNSMDSPTRKLRLFDASSTRVALVFVYSNYRHSRFASLPGAERDLARVAAALGDAGFDVKTATDPTKEALSAALDALSARSEGVDVAIIYTTGHGFEHLGKVFLIPNDYPFHEGSSRFEDLAVHVPSLAGPLRARSANLVFFGGCRTHLRRGASRTIGDTSS